MKSLNYTLLYKRLSILLCAFIFIYLYIRAWFNEPLHDEIATFFFYIYQGDFAGENMVVDANNHLLNSLIGHWLYPFAKGQFFWYRLPSLLSIFLYFYATYHLCKNYKNELVAFFSFVALNMIPFVMEYFAYTRGYGISLGFFMLSLYWIVRYIETHKLFRLIGIFGILSITISANLTFLQLGLMISVLLGLVIWQNALLSLKQKLLHTCIVLGFVGAMVPAAMYAIFLKDAGALYYGDLRGLWTTTGRSLTRYIFFNDGYLAGSIAGLVITVIALGLLSKITKTNPFKKLDFQFIIYALLFGNLLAIWILATFLKVNYPEDRTAFALILFILLALGYSFDQLQGKWRNLIFLYLFFPIVFILKMSLHTSVFSPDDRMTYAFFKKVKPHITENTSLMVYSIMRWSWPWHESQVERKAPIYNSYNVRQTYTDFLITKTNLRSPKKISELYDTVAVNPDSRHIALKRKKPMLRIKVLESSKVSGKDNQEYFNLYNTDTIPRKYYGKPALLTVKGHLKTFAEKNKLQLVFAMFDEKENLLDYNFYPFEYAYYGKKIDDAYSHHFIIPGIVKGAKTLKVYFWSRQNDLIEVKNSKCYLYLLKENKNGSR